MREDLDLIAEAIDDATLHAGDYDLYRDYDAGQHRARFASDAFKSNYEWIIQAGVVNMCPRIVSSFADLVRIESWSGTDADRAPEIADQVDLDSVLAMAVREAYTTGDAYLNVWPTADGELRVWAHKADQAGFIADPADPLTKRAYYQLFHLTSLDMAGQEVRTPRLNIYTADGWVTRWVAEPITGLSHSFAAITRDTQWFEYDEDGQPAQYQHELGDGLTWTHIAFDPDEQGGHGRSLLRDAIPLQDGLNHALHSLLVSTERIARPLRGVLNYQAGEELNPETGLMEKKHITVDETRDSFIGLNGNGPVFEWSQADPSGLIKAMETYGSWMARAVGMPVTDLIPDIGNVPSGAALRLLSAQRTATVQSFTRQLTEPVARVMQLLGVDARPIWADPAPVDESELWQRAQTKDALGFGLGDNLTELGYTPERAAEIVGNRDAEDAAASTAALRAMNQGEL